MKIFTIENETNNITLHTTEEAAQTVPDSEHFSTAEELAGLAAEWPTSRLIQIWNSVPGVVPVSKFKDKKSGVTRIWNAIQTLGGDGASEPLIEAEPEPEMMTEPIEPITKVTVEEPASPERDAIVGELASDVAPAEEQATKKATRAKKTPTGEKAVKAPHEESKTSRVIAMLKRPGGATLDEIMTEMGPCHGSVGAATTMAQVFSMTTPSMDFPENVEKIPSGLTLPALVLRISGDALPSFHEGPIVPVAIEHDPFTVR